MSKRIISVLAAAILVLGLLAGCEKSDTISAEKAQQIVLEDLGVSAEKAQMHMHVGEYAGKPCYSIYVTVNGETLQYLIDSNTGEILDITHSDHSH